MSKTEDIINFVKRIRIVNQGLIANGQSWPESFLVLTAIRGLDVKRYKEFLKSFHTGIISVATLNSLIIAVGKFEGLSSVIPTDTSSGSTSTSGPLLGTANNTTSSAPAPASSPCDKFSGTDWSQNDARKLMDKFQCFICRKDEHKWPKCPLFKHWNISKKKGHPRPNDTNRLKLQLQLPRILLHLVLGLVKAVMSLAEMFHLSLLGMILLMFSESLLKILQMLILSLRQSRFRQFVFT